MTLVLPPHIERRLIHDAEEHGMKPADYLTRLLDQSLTQDVPQPNHHDRPRPRFGSARGLVTVPSGFDEPLDDFAEYMP